MSKVAAGLFGVVLGGGTAAAGGIYLPKLLNEAAAKMPETLQEFKDGGHDLDCIRRLFPGLKSTKDTGVSELTSSGNVSLTEDGKKKDTVGCLVVNWDRKTKRGTNNDVEKWSGTIRFLWAMKGENKKGFIVFLAGKVPSEGQKLSWEGVAYHLTFGDNAWKLSHRQDAKAATKEFSSSTEETKFPRAGSDWMAMKGKGFWGFMSGKDEIGKAGEDDGAVHRSSFKGYWNWRGGEGEGAKVLEGWTQELDKWWEGIFTKTHWDMASIVKDRKGKWTERVSVLREWVA